MEFKVTDPDTGNVLGEGEGLEYDDTGEMGYFAGWWDNNKAAVEAAVTEPITNGKQVRLRLLDGEQLVHTHTWDWGT
jgi:hypothetical protein